MHLKDNTKYNKISLENKIKVTIHWCQKEFASKIIRLKKTGLHNVSVKQWRSYCLLKCLTPEPEKICK